jgi:type IV secretion system protein VirB4
MITLRRAAALRREISAADRIPYAAHVAPSIVRTAFGDYVQAFRLGGASFESSDDGELNNWHERLNVLWRNIASPNVALWTHVIRHRAGIAAGAASGNQRPTESFFADGLHGKYHHRLANETLMLNEVYLAIVHRPTSGMATSLMSKVLARAQHAGSKWALADALDACEKLAQTLKASLARYEPELLGVYQAENLRCS